ncbi:unnamed protein product [Zymoseptoria tritici ST99CH_3D1]|nr:unnamed protein product [Zymoseptoria tritici ST99CH_3D1]
MAYLAPIHRASSVRHAIKLSFLGPDTQDLIVAKANRLEIWSSSPQFPDDPTLFLQHTKALYGKATLLHKLRPATSPTDHLFVGTDRYNYLTLSWDAELKELKTEKSYVDIAEKAARDSQTGDRVHIDPTSRFMTLECYEGVVNILPIAHAGKGKRKAADDEIGELADPIQVRIPELFVRSTCFLHRRQAGAKHAKPAFALMYEDSQNKVRIKVRELEYGQSLRPSEEPSTADLDEGKEVSGQLELGASHLIPLPPPMYGMLVVGETSISYVEEFEHQVKETQPLEEATVFVDWCQIDDQRYALADDYGKLYLLMIQQTSNGEYSSHQIDILGETSRASTLVYLDEGRVFVGSHQGDSQIIQILPQKIEVLQTFPNIAPILDFAVMDMGNRSSDAPVNEFSSGQARIVTGSGAFKDGSLRSVRSGVGLEDRGDLGSLDAPISSLFALRSRPAPAVVNTLVVSFVSHTRVFVFTAEGDVEEQEQYRGFELGESTLHAGNLADGRVIQITNSSVVLADQEGDMVTDRWQSPSGTSITAVSANGNNILVSLKGASLLVLDVSGSTIKVHAQREFGSDEQVSCIALSPSIPTQCVAGFWKDGKVAFLDLETLKTQASETVTEEDSLAVPRSLTVAKILEGQPATLFVGLADGNVVTYSIQSASNPFTARKSIILGTQQANFAVLPRDNGLENVFATCEHPSLIYGSEGRIVFSAVTAENATCICSFDSFEPYGNAIAIASNDELKIAVVDEERTTHVQDLFLNQTVRRIAYSADMKAFGLGCIRRTLSAGQEEVVSCFKLVDEIAFKELDSYQLNEDELVESVIRCKLDDGSGGDAERFVIGTAYLDDQDASNAKGRILVLEVTEDRRLKLVTEISVRGACRCLAVSHGRIVAALIKTVIIYSFEYETPSSPAMVKKAAYRTSTAPIDMCVTGDIIAVTDLMKSMSLVQHTLGQAGGPDNLTEVARHFDTLWGTAVANVDENIYLESDAEGNLVVLEHDVKGFSEEDRRRLRVTSEILLGEMVNRIRRIDVSPTPNATVIPRAFLATVEGSIYLFALIAEGKQDLLIRMQNKMAEMVQSPGHVPFAKFRGFKTQVRDMGEEGPSRFVDGELIERFLDCDEDVQAEVAKELGGDVEELKIMVEGLKRIH